MKMFAAAIALAALLASGSAFGADDKKDEAKGPLALRVVLAKDAIAWDAGGKTPAEFQKILAEVEEQRKNKKGKFLALPAANKIDLTLEIVNTGKEDVTILVGGDANQYTLTLKGPGVKTFEYGLATTLEFRLSQAVKLAPGKAHAIKIGQMEDGFRGRGRRTYWTEPGEYSLSATYRLAKSDGSPGATLTSEAIKFKVTDAK